MEERGDPVTERLVVLTFDDGNKSDHAFVAPTLQRFGFGATFYISEGLGFLKHKRFYLTWPEIRELHEAGFEIGNHTRRHLSVRDLRPSELEEELRHIDRRCADHGIPRPTTMAYPGYSFDAPAVDVVRRLGFETARRGVDPEVSMRHPNQGEDINGMGRPAYWDPVTDDPMLVPTTVDAAWYWSRERFRRVVTSAPVGTVPVLTFHGIPAVEHPWVTVEPDTFIDFMRILEDEGFRGISLGDAMALSSGAAVAQPAGPIDAAASIAGIGARRHVRPTELRTGHAVAPIGIGDRRPWLSWVPASSRRGQRQRGAQLLVATDPERLVEGAADVWDSGRIATDATGVRYDGPPLMSFETYHWTVRLWGSDGQTSAWAPATTFETGPLEADDWQGDWIAAEAGVSAPLLRREIRLAGSVKRARAYVVGLGYHELSVNGRKVDDRVLAPAPSFYDDGLVRDLGLGPVPRTKWTAYDIGPLLEEGPNVVGVMLGHGWYSTESDVPRSPYHRDPYDEQPVLKLEVRIELESGELIRVASDDGWRWHAGPVTYDDYCHGEEYDARREIDGWDTGSHDASDWRPVRVVEGPAGRPCGQRCPPQRVIETITPVEVETGEAGRRVFDLGQNVTGWARIRVRGSAGSSVTLRHAARLAPGGTELDDASNMADGCTARQRDVYTLRGDPDGEIWEGRFTIHGFAIIEATLEGDVVLESVDGRVVHSDLERIGTFGCSDPLLVRIHSNTVWGYRAMFQGFPQGSADRCERLGWLGDPGFLADDWFWDYDTATFWEDWLDDLADAQLPDGSLPITAPPHWHAPWGGRPNDFAYQPFPDWMATYPLIVWRHFLAIGDRGVLARHQDGMRRLADWMTDQAEHGILRIGLGDHMEPQPDGRSSHSPKTTPIPLTSTAWWYEVTRIVADSARVLGRDEEAERYTRNARTIRAAFDREFFDRDTASYATGSQTSNALPLSLGMVPKGRRSDVTESIVADIRARGDHLSTGIIGTPALERSLPANGAADVMLDLAQQTTYPSWGHQIELGATTIWETWADDPPGMSLNIYMFGAVPTFLYGDVAGIAPTAPGWREIAVAPKLTHRLDEAHASVRTPRGVCAIEWRRDGSEYVYEVEIPAASRADVRIPTGDEWDVIVLEGDDELWRDGEGPRPRPGISRVRRERAVVRFAAGGGIYIFRVRLLPSLRADLASS